MEAVQTANFETVWAALQETDRIMKENAVRMKELRESQKETDRRIDRRMKEAAKRQEETDRRIDRRMEETGRQISRMGSRIGQLIEHFAASNLLEKFEELGYEFTVISRNHIIKNKRKEHLAEIDILLEDGEYAMVVEVKSILNKNDVIEHQERMKIVREYADKRGDKRKYLAAVAGATIESTAREYALESGIYVIEQTGDTVRVKAPPSLAYW
jgi:Holliday junction resolvase-like predicted endonuclease